MALVAIDWSPKPRSLRQFAVLAGLFCLIVAMYLWQTGRAAHPAVCWMLAGVGVGVGLLGVLWPESVRFVYLGLMVVTFPIGWLSSHLFLGVIYYGLFTPVGLWFRLIGRDALERRFDPSTETYWRPRSPAPPMRRYLRQF
jgi:hypothetical protein